MIPLDALTVLFGVALLALVIFLYRRRLRRLEDAFASASSQLELLQQSFHQFVPRRVVEDVLRRGVATRGERREVTVMFADLVGFTAMSERADPEQVVRILNGYFQAMSQAISHHSGHVAKFIGDGIMAIFGAPEPNPWHAMDAVRAALAMRAGLAAYNEELAAARLPPLAVSIGVHTGPVVAGVLGSNELIEYTVIGDVVNTASRIEGLTRKLGADILVSATVRQALDGRFDLREFEPLEVKGRQEKVQTFGVLAGRL